jgi:O-antigen ligase
MLKKLIPFIRGTDSLEVAWLLIFAATFSFSLGTSAGDLTGSLGMTNIIRMCFVSSSLLILSFHLSKGIPYPRFNAVWIFLIYICIGLISTIWSSSQIKTFGKVLEVLAPTLIVILCANKANAVDRLRRLFNWYLIIYSIAVSLHVIGPLFAPNIFIYSSTSHGFTSRWFANNTIANYASVLTLIFISRWSEAVLLQVQKIRGISRREYLFWFFVFFMACVFARGRTAMGIAVLSIILIVLRTKRIFPIILFAASIPILVIFFSDQVLEHLYRGQNLEAIKGVSGRRAMVELGLPYFLENPIMGYGFGVGSDYVFSRVGASGLAAAGFGNTISSLHNGIIEVLLGTGILGLAALSVSMIKTFWAYARRYLQGRDLDMAMLGVYIIPYTFVSGMGVGGWMSDCLGFYLVSSAILSLDGQKELRNQL